MPEIVERRRNWAPWLALLFVLVAIGLNAATFVVPGTPVILWLGLLAGLAAVAYSVVGLRRAFGRSQLFGGKISSSVFGVLALLVCGLLVFAWFQARALPPSAGAPHVGQKVPDFTLANTQGNKVSLAQLLGHDNPATLAAVGASDASTGSAPPKAVLLIFYRGYW